MTKSIEVGTIYAKEEFLARTGLKQAAWLAAVRSGLRVSRVHGRVYVRGDAWLTYAEKHESGELVAAQ